MKRTLRRLAAVPGNDTRPPIIQINNGTFYRQHPLTTPKTTEFGGQIAIDSNPPLFPGLTFTLPSFSGPVQKWSVISKSSAARTAFLQILRGQHICLPPTARSYPYLSTDEIAEKDLKLRSAQNAIQYVGFDAERGRSGGGGMRGSYLAARYESFKDETDFSLWDFLLGNTELNPDEKLARHPDRTLVEDIMRDLKLGELAEMPVTHLSNGQTRRAKIAKALLAQPEVLLLDGPFMGLDPPTLEHLSNLLEGLADAQAPRLILSLKPDEHIPNWITHMAFLTQNHHLKYSGTRADVIGNIHIDWAKTKGKRSMKAGPSTEEELEIAEVSRNMWEQSVSTTNMAFSNRRDANAYHRERKRLSMEIEFEMKGEEPAEYEGHEEIVSRDGFNCYSKPPTPGESVIEMEGVKVQYGDKVVLGNWQQKLNGEDKEGLWWDVRRGQRWGVFGPNGSGKTTLISLITSDHPQTYSLPIKIFGRTRLPKPGQPGISIFDLQKRIGHSSPEVHVYFPKHLSIRRAIESAWADTPLTKVKITPDIDQKVSAALMWFRPELVPALGPVPWMKDEMDRSSKRLDSVPLPLKDRPTGGLNHLIKARSQIEDGRLDMETQEWADNIKFSELSFSAQRVVLFIRAVIRNPDLVVLDEAFSGMDDFARDKCHLFLSQGEKAILHWRRPSRQQVRGPIVTESDISRLGLVILEGLKDSQALIVISHKREEVPGCVRDWMCLPESGQGLPRLGQLDGPLELGSGGWKQIWKTGGKPDGVGKPSFDVCDIGRVVPKTDSTKDPYSLGHRKARIQKRMAKVAQSKETPEARRERRAKLNKLRQEADVKLKSLQGRKVTRQFINPGTADDKKVHLERRRLLAKVILANETPEEKEKRVHEVRARQRARFEALSKEQQQAFMTKVRQRSKNWWDSLSEEQMAARRETMRKYHQARRGTLSKGEKREKYLGVYQKYYKEIDEEKVRERIRRRKERVKEIWAGLSEEERKRRREEQKVRQRRMRERKKSDMEAAEGESTETAKEGTAKKKTAAGKRAAVGKKIPNSKRTSA